MVTEMRKARMQTDQIIPIVLNLAWYDLQAILFVLIFSAYLTNMNLTTKTPSKILRVADLKRRLAMYWAEQILDIPLSKYIQFSACKKESSSSGVIPLMILRNIWRSRQTALRARREHKKVFVVDHKSGRIMTLQTREILLYIPNTKMIISIMRNILMIQQICCVVRRTGTECQHSYSFAVFISREGETESNALNNRKRFLKVNFPHTFTLFLLLKFI